jgi:hypothetical protein
MTSASNTDRQKQGSLLETWISERHMISFDLPVVADWESGLPTAESLRACLRDVLQPIYKSAGHFLLIGNEFGPDSFSGQGAKVLAKIRRQEGGLWRIDCERLLLEEVDSFVTDPAQGRGVPKELRGTIIFPIQMPKRAEDLRLTNAHVVKNYSVLFGSPARRALKALVKTCQDTVFVTLTDRTDMFSAHVFGDREVLLKFL